jgi:hypothetical protein
MRRPKQTRVLNISYAFPVGSRRSGDVPALPTFEDGARDQPRRMIGPRSEEGLVQTTALGLAKRGERSSVVRIPPVMHSTTDKADFLPLLNKDSQSPMLAVPSRRRNG